MTCTAQFRTKPMLTQQLFIKNSYTESHKNLANGLFSDITSQTDICGLRIKDTFLLRYEHTVLSFKWAIPVVFPITSNK